MSRGCLGLASSRLLENASELQMKPQVDFLGAIPALPNICNIKMPENVLVVWEPDGTHSPRI